MIKRVLKILNNSLSYCLLSNDLLLYNTANNENCGTLEGGGKMLKLKNIRHMHCRKRIRIYGVTWTCQRCGAVFTTEAAWAMHVLRCG